MAVYVKGLSTREIEECVWDIYGVEVSASLGSKITDRIMPEVRERQARPLDDIYPVVFFEGGKVQGTHRRQSREEVRIFHAGGKC